MDGTKKKIILSEVTQTPKDIYGQKYRTPSIQFTELKKINKLKFNSTSIALGVTISDSELSLSKRIARTKIDKRVRERRSSDMPKLGSISRGGSKA